MRDMQNGKIESVAFGGDGVLKQDGLVVFIPFTAPQDRVAIEIHSKKKNFARGKLLKIYENSPSRVSPRCPYFGTCGGCQLQHLNESAQIDAKRAFVLDALARIGKIKIDHLEFTPAKQLWHYRRHIRLNLRPQNRGFAAGYIGHDPAQFVPIKQCPIFLSDLRNPAPSGAGQPSSVLFSGVEETPPFKEEFFKSLQDFVAELQNNGIKDASVRLIKNDQKLLLAFQFFPKLPNNHFIAEKFLFDCQGILMHSPEEIKEWGQTDCLVELFGLKAKFSPFGFVQNHPEQNENLYRAVLDALPSEAGTILDLYCGIGLTSLLFARKGWRAIGVEAHPETVALAKENASLNGLMGVEFHEGKSEDIGIELLKKEKPDAVLCNPPRTGLDPSIVQALLEARTTSIFYISCMPSTLARDLQKLEDGGYKIQKIHAFDMFPQTTHVETFVQLKRVL